MLYKTASGAEIQTVKQFTVAEIIDLDTPEKLNVLQPLNTQTGEYVFLRFEVITPRNVTEEAYIEIENYLTPFISETKKRLGVTNRYRQSMYFYVDSKEPRTRIKLLKILKQGTPVSDEKPKTRIPRPADVLHY
jgi:hypothetical protein